MSKGGWVGKRERERGETQVHVADTYVQELTIDSTRLPAVTKE